MGRSTMVSEVLLFACFVVLTKIPEIVAATAKPQYAKHAFLAGENTPVWIAEVNQQEKLSYKKIVYTKMDTPFPIVGTSINHWNAFKQNGGHKSRVVRSVQNSKNFTSPEKLSAPSDAREGSFYSQSPVEKRSTAGNEVVYPSILVVMDYEGVPVPSSGTEGFIEELVLYALAFWGTVDRSLRNLNLRVSLRIAGIVITESRDASPYLSGNGEGPTFVTAMPEMVNYWRWRWWQWKDPDLPVGSYDIVVHMTDLYPLSNTKVSNNNGFSDLVPKNESFLAVGMQGPPCRYPDRISGLIVYDDFTFDGLDRTIAQMPKVLGVNERSAKDYGLLSESWSSESVIPLLNARKSGPCMSEPKEYHSPGAPVERILAGELLPTGNQCEVYGNEPDGWMCRDSIPDGDSCYFMRCSKRYSLSDTCSQERFTLDGNFCNAEMTKICLDGQCVDKIYDVLQGLKLKILETFGDRCSDQIFGTPKDNDKEPPIEVTHTPLSNKDGFLLGEETPVWVATYRPKTKSHFESGDFKRVKPNKSVSIVKKALNYWDSLKKGRSFPFRKKRSIDDRGNLTYTEQFHDALKNAGIHGFDSPSLVEKRSADSNEVVYPSVLVFMDYEAKWTIEEQVLYALAFWSTVDSTFRKIQNPRVSLRIVGIVINEFNTPREVTPYLQSDNGYTFYWALPPMIKYWKSVSERKKIDLPTGSYDIVVHMTDIFPRADREMWVRSFRSRKKSKVAADHFGGAASQTLPCQTTNQIGAVIVRDNFGFDGLFRAIAYMSQALGGRDTRRRYFQDFPREWSKKMLDTISNSLKHASCMSAPKEYHRPGTPVAPILAGELIPNEKQCERAGYEPNAWTCWDTTYSSYRSTCRALRCSNGRVWGRSCASVGRPLDGSFCNVEETKICLDGECVDK